MSKERADTQITVHSLSAEQMAHVNYYRGFGSKSQFMRLLVDKDIKRMRKISEHVLAGKPITIEPEINYEVKDMGDNDVYEIPKSEPSAWPMIIGLVVGAMLGVAGTLIYQHIYQVIQK